MTYTQISSIWIHTYIHLNTFIIHEKYLFHITKPQYALTIKFFALMNIAVRFHEQNTCVSRIWKISIILKVSAANMSLQADKQTPNITYYTMVNIMNPFMVISKRQVAASFAVVLYSIHSKPDIWYAHNMNIHISVTSTSYKVCTFMPCSYTCFEEKCYEYQYLFTADCIMTIQVRTQIPVNPACSIDIWDRPQTDKIFVLV